MRRIVPCKTEDVKMAIIDILNEPESEGEPGGESISVDDLAKLLKNDFELLSSELHLVLSQLSLEGKIGISLRTECSNDSLPYAVADRICLSPPRENEEAISVDCTADLIRLIGAGIGELAVVKNKLWDGRIVKGLRYKGEEKPDLRTVEAIVPTTDKILQGLVVEKFLKREESFIVQTGTYEDLRVVEWSISKE